MFRNTVVLMKVLIMLMLCPVLAQEIAEPVIPGESEVVTKQVSSETPDAFVTDTMLSVLPEEPVSDTELVVPALSLPHNLTPWGMYLQADWVVKTVMIGLALASILTWTVFIAKLLELRKAEQEQKAELTQVSAARGIAELISAEQVPEVVKLAAKELERSADALHDPVGIKERLLSGLERFEAASGRKINYGTGVLASIGSTAPFVGLFGTVWGIMNSFIGISRAQTTNLAVVAPGIAEALLATAIGLVAAIPAVIMYNYFSRRISAYKALLADTSAAVLRLVSRDLSRGQVGQED